MEDQNLSCNPKLSLTRRYASVARGRKCFCFEWVFWEVVVVVKSDHGSQILLSY